MLDEPIESLAPFVVRRIEWIIRDLADDGITILLVEQNIPVALDVSSHTSIMETGRVVHEGASEVVSADEAVLNRHLGVGTVE